MPLLTDTSSPLWRDILIAGAPDTGKSASLLTFPRPLYVISCPLEEGLGTLPRNLPDVKVFSYPLKLSDAVSWGDVIEQVRKDVVCILAGTQGPVKGGTLALDGVHMLYDCWTYKTTGGVIGEVKALEAFKLYPATNHPFFMDLLRWKQQAIERGMYYVVTAWMTPKKDQLNTANEKMRDITFKEWPDLAGQAGKEITGKFSIKLKSVVEGEGRDRIFWWKTTTDTDTGGIGIKGPVEIVSKIPLLLPQKWPSLAKYLVAPPAPDPVQSGPQATEKIR